MSNSFEIDIVCLRAGSQSRSANSSSRELDSDRIGRYTPIVDNVTLKLPRPDVTFSVKSGDTAYGARIEFDSIYMHEMVFLVYYPGFLDPTDLSNDIVSNSVHCHIVGSAKILIYDLEPTTVYTFCALIRDEFIRTPFQCKSHQTETPFNRQTWIYQEQKGIILTSLMLLIMLSLVIGVVLTYLLIRRMPTLMRGSKRVVMVNNRTKEVMVLPGGSRTNSWHKETPVKAEAPTYMTPLPRTSFDHR